MRIERLRRRILDLFFKRKYELVMPPLLEYTDSLLTGTGHDLELRTFKVVDQLSGRTMGVRADITPQVARIDAHLLNHKGVTRPCYCGSVLHARAAGVSGELEAELFEALQRKDAPEIERLAKPLDAATREALLLLPQLYGGAEVLDVAARRLPKIAELRNALKTLRALAKACPVPISFDLAELRGYHYHSGVVFDAYCEGVTSAVARGGRYDEVGKAFGRARPATGFSIDLRTVVAVVK